MKNYIKITDKIKHFQSFTSQDPKIEVIDERIEFRANYWNLSLVGNSFFFILMLFLFIKSVVVDVKAAIGSLIAAGLFLYMIIRQLTYLNFLSINLRDGEIIIKPNIVIGVFLQRKELKFDSIKNITCSYDTFNPAFRRYEITAILKSQKKVKLITCNEKNSQNIANAFSYLLTQ